MKWTGRVFYVVLWLLMPLFLVACMRTSPKPTLEPRTTPTLAPTLARPADTATAQPSPEPSPLPPTPTLAPVGPTASPSPHADSSGFLPAPLARISLAPADAQLDDLLLNSHAGHLYVTDTSGLLHVLDAATYLEIARLAGSGKLTLDPDHSRLYVSSERDEGELTVINTQDLTVVGTISPGGRVALDSQRKRLYVGNPEVLIPGEEPRGIRVYDAETLIKVDTIAQPGIPVYNALRDELYVVAYTANIVDPDTLTVTGDLLPEITEQPLALCNGCLAATNAHIDLDHNLLVVEVTTLSAGKGPGTEIPPRFFDATTLDEISDPAETPPVERGCRHRLILAEPVDGRIYRGEHYNRYISYNNLLVSNQEGRLLTWRDGLGLGVSNPNTGQMYIPHGEDLLVLDLTAIVPVGTVPVACVHTLDAERGRIYAFAGRDLIVLSDEGGEPETPVSSQPGPQPDDSLPTGQAISLHPSPDYARDQTLFAVAEDRRLYRSRDGGDTWVQLRGGLPTGQYLRLDLAISPGFGTDQTLYAGGAHREFWGEGVYRSTDGGDTWQPMWQDLEHLRVYDVALSPHYDADDTLLAYSNYQRITPWQSGASVFRSTDRGLSWTLVVTGSAATDLPPAEQLLPTARTEPAVQFRKADRGQSLERSLDSGQTWEPLVVPGQPEFYIQSAQKSPTFAVDHTVYVQSGPDLFRSRNGGQSWEHWYDDLLSGSDNARGLATLVLSPALPDGKHQLLVVTHKGEFRTLDPEQLTWEAVQIAEQWPTVLEDEWVGEIETAPNGEVWLGTWGGGLVHYADGSIRARHTITDGLPTQYIGAIAAAGNTLWTGGALPPGSASLDGDAWTTHPLPGDDGVGALYDIIVGPDGTVWAGAQAPGLLRWTGQAWELIPDSEGLTGWRINDIETDDSGTVWAASAGGLVFFGAGSWSGEGNQEATAVELGPEGTAYLLHSDASVWRYAGRQWRELPPLQEERALSAPALHLATDGAVWVGTHAGAFRYDGQSWQRFTMQDGLPANDVRAINQGANNLLWFGTSNGAARVDPETLGLSPVVWPALDSPTAVPQAAATPTPCALRPAEFFASAYKEVGVAGRLGCPTAGAESTEAAYQPFEYGLMFWRADEAAVYVLEASSGWAHYPDAWDSSQPLADPILTPPEGLLQPVRGFGKAWQEQLGGPGSSIGWALQEEQGYEMLVQPFAGGQMFLGPWDQVYILYADNAWESAE